MAKEKILKRNKRRTFTQEQKIYAVNLLRENNYDYKKTSAETGASQICLRQWKHLYQDMTSDLSRVAVYQERAEERIVASKVDFIEKHFEELGEVTRLAIVRMKELLPQATLHEATSALRAVADIYKIVGVTNKGNEENKESVSVISQVVNQQININN